MIARAAAFPLALAMMLGTTPAAIASAPVREPTYGEKSPEAARAALNRQQALDAQKQLADNAANRQASEAATRAREDQIRTDQAAWEAEKARLAADHAAAMDQWRADVAACRAGDRTRCRHR
jgi:selenocysteine lyase/cysteine desulfurase